MKLQPTACAIIAILNLRSKIHQILRTIIAVSLSLSACGCASHYIYIAVSGATVDSEAEYLNKRIQQVDIKDEEMPMLIFHLGDRIASATGQVQSLSWQGHDYPIRRVTYHAKDISVGQLFDDICQQTGWTYHATPIGITFAPPKAATAL